MSKSKRESRNEALDRIIDLEVDRAIQAYITKYRNLTPIEKQILHRQLPSLNYSQDGNPTIRDSGFVNNRHPDTKYPRQPISPLPYQDDS